jgi:hypothetical protein
MLRNCYSMSYLERRHVKATEPAFCYTHRMQFGTRRAFRDHLRKEHGLEFT